MEQVTDDMLMALADGELDQATAARLRQRVAADTALQHRLALFEDSAAALRLAMDPGPVPDRLVQTIMSSQSDNIVPLAPPRRRAEWRQGLIAATLALGFGLGGYQLGRQGAEGADDLAPLATLATGDSLRLADGTRARVLGSYETAQGLCRMIAAEGASGTARQIICRDGAGWHVALRVEVPPSGDFVPASDPLTEVVDQYLDGIGAGPALDPAAEGRALAAGG